MATCRIIQIDPYLPLCKNKWIKALNRRSDILNLIEEKVQNGLEVIGTGIDFLNRTVLTQTLQSTINKWHLTKLTCICMAKNTIIQKSSSLKNEKKFKNYLSDGIFTVYILITTSV